MRILFLVLLFAPSLTGPCGDGPWSAYWYSLTYSVDGRSLPSNVSFSSSGSQIQVRNTTTTPLFILYRLPDADEHEQISGIPFQVADFGPWIKVVNNQYYYWANAEIGWSDPMSGVYTIENVETNYFPASYRDLNPLSSERPANQVLPQDQASAFTAVYGDQLLTIPVTTHYTLNPNYEQTVHQKISCGWLDWLWLLELAPWFIGAVLLGGVTLLVGRAIRNAIWPEYS